MDLELSGSFRRPLHERQRIVAGVCDRLVGDLDRSLRVARELCTSLDSGLFREADLRDDRVGRGLTQ
jgi:hypothetical protein